MDERRIADYFVVAGLSDNPELVDEDSLPDLTHLKPTYNQLPITDIAVIFPALGEKPPAEYEIVEHTPTGLSANLNHGSIRCMDCFLCFRRGRDKPPLVDIGVMYEGKERLMDDASVITHTPTGHPANVNNSTALTLLTFRRGKSTMPCNTLVVTDVCVVIASKGESPPHAFCCINKNLNKGLVGSDVFLCYKKSANRTRMLTYKPSVMFKYPEEEEDSDRVPYPCPETVALFCLPMGATLELWPSEADESPPVFSTFVLTIADAKLKVYGAALTFYEKFDCSKLTDEQRKILGYDQNKESDKDDAVTNDEEIVPKKSRHELYVNKSICLLSRWPFSDTFQKWLNFLYIIVKSSPPPSTQPPTPSLEHYIHQLFHHVPFPSPRTLLQLTDSERTHLGFTQQPETLPLPRSAAGFKHLLLNLGADNAQLLLLMALTERKVLVHSLRPDLITAVVEALGALLFPFRWQCAYVPLCPLILFEVLHCPLPFLVGVDSRIFKLYNPPNDVSCVDLDTNTITVADTYREFLNIRILPKKAAKQLKATLEDLYIQMGQKPTAPSSDVFQRKMEEQRQELEIQQAFLRFMAISLRGYRTYLLPITKAPTKGATDLHRLFNLRDFLRSRDKSHQSFFSQLVETQMFTRFIEERSFVADGDQTMAFFDDCCERLMAAEEAGDAGRRLLFEGDLGKGASDKTVVILPPEVMSDEVHNYSQFVVNAELLAKINKKNSHRLSLIQQSVIPGSPMARRTKHEIQSAQKLAKKSIRYPEQWARCLNGTCYTLYFMVLPSFLSLNVGHEWTVLQQYYEQLVKATRQKLPCDEVCYRVMMQLCGEYSRPLLTVNLRLEMKQSGIELNALTYGLYNRCVLEANWPKPSTRMLWNKVRNVILGTAHFKFAARRQSRHQLQSSSTEGGVSLLDTVPHTISVSSLDSQNSETGGILEKIRSHVVNIVKFGSNGPSKEDDTASSTSAHKDDNEDTDITATAQPEANADDDDNTNTTNEPPPPPPTTTTPATTTLDDNPEVTAVTSTIKPLASDRTSSSQFATILESPTESLRILSRQESAGDANIIDKLQQIGINYAASRTCARSLQFTEEIPELGNDAGGSAKNSPSKVSPRTLVVRDDPLGALDELPPPPPTPPTTSTSNTLPASLDGNIAVGGAMGDDVTLYRAATVPRSSTFDSASPLKKIHRSETVPAATVASSLSNIGSSIKSSFSRYSPVRFSLKKADLKASQLLENTISNLSPSNFSSKKSNDLIQGGLSSLKSAASSITKKFDEIKEAIATSNTSTPVKACSADKLATGDYIENFEGESTDGSEISERYRKVSTDYCSHNGSCMNLRDFEDLPDNIYSVPEDVTTPPPTDGPPPTTADIRISLTTSTKCTKCTVVLYDEEIMANWNADDSNLNTVCPNCKQSTVPLLTVTIQGGGDGSSEAKVAPFSMPYLNPLVLRKELENVLTQEGDLSPAKRKFVEDHPIIYWNLVWAFERISVLTHLPKLYLKSEDALIVAEMSKERTNGSVQIEELINEVADVTTFNSNSIESENDDENSDEEETLGVMLPVENGADPLTQELSTQEMRPGLVRVSCLWDNPGLHCEGPLLYLVWKHRDPTQTTNTTNTTTNTKAHYTEQKNTIRLMQNIIHSVRNNDLLDPLKALLMERQQRISQQLTNGKTPSSSNNTTAPIPNRSMYRDILFLACVEFGRRNIDLNAFDREYQSAFSRLPDRSRKQCEPQDMPIALSSLFCRQFFRPLTLH